MTSRGSAIGGSGNGSDDPTAALRKIVQEQLSMYGRVQDDAIQVVNHLVYDKGANVVDGAFPARFEDQKRGEDLFSLFHLAILYGDSRLVEAFARTPHQLNFNASTAAFHYNVLHCLFLKTRRRNDRSVWEDDVSTILPVLIHRMTTRSDTLPQNPDMYHEFYFGLAERESLTTVMKAVPGYDTFEARIKAAAEPSTQNYFSVNLR